MEFLKFDELEKKINGLIADHALLKKRNLELEGLLQNKSMELEEAKQKNWGVEGRTGCCTHKGGLAS